MFYTRPRMYLFTYAFSDEDTNELYAEYHLSRQVSSPDNWMMMGILNPTFIQGAQNLQEGNQVLRLAQRDARLQAVEVRVSGEAESGGVHILSD